MSQVRRIITTYSFKRKEKKITRSVHANKAVTNAVEHMRLNDYAASVAQVSCSETGKLYAIITRNMAGRVSIRYTDPSMVVITDVYGESL